MSIYFLSLCEFAKSGFAESTFGNFSEVQIIRLPDDADFLTIPTLLVHSCC